MVFSDRRLGIGLLAFLCVISVGVSEAQPKIMMVGAVAPGTGVGATGPLHIAGGRRVSFTHYMTDGAGYRWDIQYYGTVGSGMNSIFSGAMYCQVNGTNIRSSGYGWANKAGDEIEIGPYARNNLRCYRRIKVYKDSGLARWLDIFENPGGQDVTVQVALYTNCNYTIRSTTTDTGKGVFGPKDSAFIAQTSGGSCPKLLYIACGKRSKVRPSVTVQGNSIYLRYNLTIPANKTVVLCHFLAQNMSTDTHAATMKKFRAHQALKDLPGAMRKLIVNFSGGGMLAGVDLDRSEASDVVFLKSGDPIFGKIANESFSLQTYFGPLDLPAAHVIGMGTGEAPDERLRFVLASGQVVSGTTPGTKLSVTLPAGGALNIPLEDIRQWSYRVSRARPNRDDFTGPFVELRTNDRLAFDPAGVKLTLRSRHGTLRLDSDSLFEILLDNRGNAVHRVIFLNGSRLAGFIEPGQLSLDLKLGRKLNVPRDMIVRMRFAAEPKRDDHLAHVVLSNEDELYGRLVDKKIDLITPYNPIPLIPAHIKSIRRDGQTVVEMWNRTVHKGSLSQRQLGFQIVPGPLLGLHPGQFVSIVRPEPLPPEDVRKRVEELIARLGSESYKDRQEATEQLSDMEGIGPLLKKYLDSSDPEVRQRIEQILEKVGGAKKSETPRPPQVLRSVIMGRGPR